MANTADSVAIFNEGTFEEQILELVEFVARSRPEDERGTYIASFKGDLKIEEDQKPLEEDTSRKRAVFVKLLGEIKQLGEGNDKEIEGFFNLVFSHLFTLWSAGSPEIKDGLDSLLRILSSTPTEKTPIKYRILSNLFNAIPQTSPLRLSVYSVILQLASANDQLETLQLQRPTVEKWLTEWQISPEEKSRFLKSLVDAFTTAGQSSTAYDYSLSYVRSLPANSSTTQSAAVDLIATALCLPALFDFDPLFKLDAIVSLKDHELFSLLQVFLSGGLPELKQWQATHSGVAEKYNLSSTDLESKMRLLTLAALGFKNIGQNLPYATIAETLQVDVVEVEKWVIDIIRAGLLWGKLSQTSQSLYVVRSSVRTFEKEQWEILEKRILAWKSGLQSILEVVNNAKRMAGYISQVPVTSSA
ncbi:Eukaryotic translation initiation factor 3 subunit M [Leucoagaricus sp. SymC.cos]|nr:Eukaryotic translation initiation factor 3 subunit M [Leucoagaricus sp. SymC.cos]